MTLNHRQGRRPLLDDPQRGDAAEPRFVVVREHDVGPDLSQCLHEASLRVDPLKDELQIGFAELPLHESSTSVA